MRPPTCGRLHANMNPELFISRRISTSPSGRGRSAAERIAVVSVALGVAVMIVTLAVITGFATEISRRLSGMGAHIVVAPFGSEPLSPTPFGRDASTEEAMAAIPGIESVRPFVSAGGVIRSEKAMQGFLLKGIEGGYEETFFAEMLSRGELPAVGGEQRTKDILISRTTADLLELSPGDRVETVFLAADGDARRDRYRVTGIYSTGMDELEALALTDMRNVARIAGPDAGQISGYEVRLDGFGRIDELTARLNDTLAWCGDGTLYARNIVELNPGIFDWLRTHDVNAAVVIAVMAVVALFNMATALLIIVLERTRTVGLLKTLGMSDVSLQRVFLYRAAAIALRGILWGNAAGLALCAVQRFFKPLRLDSAGYLLSEVPVDVVPWHVILLDLCSLAAIVAVMALPVRIASGIKPEKALRYD